MTDHDPYRPPRSGPDPSGDLPAFAGLWRFLFWFSALLMSLALIGFPHIENTTVFDYIDFVVSSIATVGLFGFAYQKPISSIVFWRWFFYGSAIEGLFYSLVLPFTGLPRYGEEMAFDGGYLTELVYMALILVALYRYAYRSPAAWPLSRHY